MRPPVAFRPLAVHFLGTRPALWCAEDDHRPPRAFCILLSPCLILDGLNLGDDGIQSGGHQSVHSFGLVTLDEVRLVPTADEELLQLLMADPRKHRRICDLVTVEVQNRQDGSMFYWIDELGGVRGCCQ